MRVSFKRLCCCFTALCTVIGSAPRSAHADYIERLTINRFGQRGLPGLHSARTLGVGAMTVGVYGNGTLDQNFLKRSRDWLPYNVPPMFDTTAGENPAISLFNVNPFIGIGIADFFDVSAMLPLHIDMIGSYQEVGPGDLQLTFKLGTHSSARTPVFDLGFLGALSIPTGSEETGVFPRHAYYFNKDSLAVRTPQARNDAYFSSQNVDFETHLLMALDFGALKEPVPISLQIDYGMHFATKVSNDDAVLMSAALACRPVNALTFATVFDAEMRNYNFTHGFGLKQDPFHITPCIMVTLENGFNITLGSTISLASGGTYTYVKGRSPGDSQLITTGIEPKWNMFIQVCWSGVFADRDRDKDGIVDRYDECPALPEDVDGFRDDDGCPDPDNDGDEMQDSLDKCPDKAEDRDGYKDDDGCPDEDNDGDRIQDTLDQCPNHPEDYDGFNDRDGCPDYDNDRDGVRDSFDRCPIIPEDLDGFQDGDGCPDIDNDQDGVVDSLDKCPGKPGSPDNAGCVAVEKPRPPAPKTKEIKRGRVVLRGVDFTKGSAAVDPSSFVILDEVAQSLSDWPLVQIEIQGHTDNQGSAMSKLNLSTARAEAVRAYLINKGIASSRLAVVGKSDTSPLGDNASKAGRAVNNRIELRRIDSQGDRK